MGVSSFHCQQFSVCQQQSAMKVCTDALLFGAMAPIQAGDQVLDIGTGTGLLALMAAQLGAGQVTAVELTAAAYAEACLNFNNSPWAARLDAVHQAIQDYTPQLGRQFDVVICNPPFFENHSKTLNPLRNIARHTDHLPFTELMACVARLLADNGVFYVLLPVHAIAKLVLEARTVGLYLNKQTEFRGFEHNAAKVAALIFSRDDYGFTKSVWTIYQAPRIYTEASSQYLAPFLLRFKQAGQP